jgi:hypothetical protein
LTRNNFSGIIHGNKEDKMMDKVREIKMRRWAARLGLFVSKSRAQRWSLDNHQGYAVLDQSRNDIIHGNKYELDLAQVEKFLREYEAKLKAS